MSPELCTVTEAAKLLGVSETRVRHLAMRGDLEAVPTEPRRRRYVTRASVYQRIASMDTPPGALRSLNKARFLRELTRPRGEPSRSGWNFDGMLAAYAQHLFGSTEAAPYRAKLHTAACELIRAVELKDWGELERAQAALYALWLEYEFVAKPLESALKMKVAPGSLQASLFEKDYE